MYQCVCVHMCAFICVCLNVSMCICELKIVPKASFMVGKYSTTNGNHRLKNILYLALYTRDNAISTWSYSDEIAKEMLYNLCFYEVFEVLCLHYPKSTSPYRLILFQVFSSWMW